MFPYFLLLLTLLGPGNSLHLQDTWRHETMEALGPVHLRERRQVFKDDDFEEPDYYTYGTDPPETLVSVTNSVTAHLELWTSVAVSEQRVSTGAGASETVTAQVATTGPAGPDTERPAVGMPSTDSVTQWSLATVEMTNRPASTEAKTLQPAHREAETSQPAPAEAETSQPAHREAETSQPAPAEAETSQPASMEAETSQPSSMVAETSHPASMEAETSQPAHREAETSQPAPAEAETSQPAPMEAETSQPAHREAETSQPAPTEAETSQPAPMEAETSQPAEAETSQPAPTETEATQLPRSQVVESLFTTSATTEAPSTEPTAMETLSTEANESVIFLGPSIGHLPDTGLKKGLIVTPGSSTTPTPPGTSDLIPVKQCLLAILILASLATIFLVCTVVLAVRLSRKTHTYPVRNYSPTEMICISSLLPEGGDGAPVTANGGPPKAQDLKTERSADPDGDDLTLHSFLP